MRLSFKKKKNYLFLVALGLCCYTLALSSFSEQGPLFAELHGPLTAVASPVSEHRIQAHGLRSCGSWALVALQHVESSQTRNQTLSLALAGRFSPTAPPREALMRFFKSLNEAMLAKHRLDVYI